MKRKERLKDYTVDYPLDGKPQVIYHGIWYTAETTRRERLLYAAFSLCLFGLAVISGFLDADTGRVIYVALPYTAVFLPAALAVMSTLPLIRGKTRFTAQEKDRVFTRARVSGYFCTALSALCVMGVVIFCSGHREDVVAQLPFMLCMSVFCAVSVIFTRFHIKIEKTVKIESNNS